MSEHAKVLKKLACSSCNGFGGQVDYTGMIKQCHRCLGSGMLDSAIDVDKDSKEIEVCSLCGRVGCNVGPAIKVMT